MAKYISPGVYVKETDVSYVPLPGNLEFPELVKDLAVDISSKIKIKHEYDIFDATLRFWIDNPQIGVGVHLYDGCATVFHFNKSYTIEYSKPNAMGRIAEIVEEELSKDVK